MHKYEVAVSPLIKISSSAYELEREHLTLLHAKMHVSSDKGFLEDCSTV